MSKLKIGIDLDNTINTSVASANFFSLFTNSMKDSAKIYIITDRDNSDQSRKEIITELEKYNINYDELVIIAEKAEFILKEGISVYVDDTDEYFLDLPESVIILKIREPGNFSFSKKKWIYGNKTGININDKGK